MIKKFIAIALIFIIFAAKEVKITTIDDLAYVVALGLDVGENDLLKVTFQIATTEENSSSSSSSKGSSSSTTSTIETSSIDNAINLVNTYISKEISLSHCKAIVISEDLASKGISNYLYTLINKLEISPKCHVIISNVDSEYFLAQASNNLESNSTNYYEIISTTSEFTGYTEPITLREFFSKMGDSFTQPYTILGSANTDSLRKNSDSNSMPSNTNQDSLTIKAGEANIKSENKIEITGIAIFKEDTMVGELNAIETICHLILNSNLEKCIVSIPSPFNDTETLDLNICLRKDTKFKVKLINGSPYVTADVFLDAKILTMNQNSNYLDEANLDLIEKYANSYLKSNLLAYLYKTSKEYDSDVLGLGKYVVTKFKTTGEWQNYNWSNKYQDTFFDVNVDTKVNSGYILMEK